MVDADQRRPLVLCADDYAFNEAVSSGIRRLAQAGRITATSAMVLAPAWPAEAQRLRAAGADIDVGLHLDWTSPLAVAAGHGCSLPAAMARAAAGGFSIGAARKVIEHQLDRFESAWGGPPDHVDGHQHVQQFRGVREALVAAISRRYSGRKPWLRISRIAPGTAGVKGRVISALGAHRLEALAREAGIPVLPHLAGAYEFSGGAPDYARRMAGWLAELRPGTVIMCHPADGAGADDPIAAARQTEFGWLGSDEFPAMLAGRGLRLCRGAAMEGV